MNQSLSIIFYEIMLSHRFMPTNQELLNLWKPILQPPSITYGKIYCKKNCVPFKGGHSWYLRFAICNVMRLLKYLFAISPVHSKAIRVAERIFLSDNNKFIRSGNKVLFFNDIQSQADHSNSGTSKETLLCCGQSRKCWLQLKDRL